MNKKYILFIRGFLCSLDRLLTLCAICFSLSVMGQIKPDTTNKSLKDTIQLDEVQVSTGYQTLPKERAVGAFEQIGQDVLDRKPSTNLLDRLDGNSSVLFDKRTTNANGQQRLQLRGLYTLTEAISQPLIILDNFPYQGDLSSINPEDVAGVTILKDAAAASIWGARAGNGVIVITTKKGKLNSQTKVNGSANVNVTQKPDLFSLPLASASDVVNLQIFLFSKGYFNADLRNKNHKPVDEVVEILDQRQRNVISAADSATRIDGLRQQDVRNDFEEYLYRPAITQQYNADLSGGGSNYTYRYSMGYSRNRSTLVGDDDRRLTLRADQSVKLLPMLTFNLAVSYNRLQADNNSLGGYGGAYSSYYGRQLPIYARLADDQGHALPINKQYRMTYLDGLNPDQFLDWQFRPLDEMKLADNTQTDQVFVADAGLHYDLNPHLSVDLKYQYQQGIGHSNQVHSQETYFTRNLINSYTNPASGDPALLHPVPLGGILDRNANDSQTHNARIQLNYDQTFSTDQRLSLMGGGELRSVAGSSQADRTYGYDAHGNVALVNYIATYRTSAGFYNTVPSVTSLDETTQRYLSFFGNGNYQYKNRYNAFFSVRNDGSNILGVRKRNKWNPLWSAGLSWELNKEAFYHSTAVPSLKLRLSYGFSGNVYLGQSAYTTINYYSAHFLTNRAYASIQNAGNPDLRWEKVRTLNLGTDLALLAGRLSISADYYRKNSYDVFGVETLDPSSGLSAIFANSANLNGSGFEVNLNGQPLRSEVFAWDVQLNGNYAGFKVSKYLSPNQVTHGYVDNGTTLIPMPGYSPYSIVSFRWAGLNPETGQPQGYLNGEVSTDYVAIAAQTPNDQQVIHGPAVPQWYGNMLHTFRYRQFSLSVNVNFRLAYFFRRPSIDYYRAFVQGNVPAEYADRWQKPGDEQHTNVPAISYPVNSEATSFYSYSEINAGRGDNIRLADIRAGYLFSRKTCAKLPFNEVYLSAYTGLDALLWKANTFGLDPDHPGQIQPPHYVSFQVRIGF